MGASSHPDGLLPAGAAAHSLRPMLKHNTYFDAQVQSIGFERLGRRLSAGVIDRD